MLHSIIARIIAASPARLVKFFQTLEQRLEAFLTQHHFDVQAIKADIAQVEAYAEADIAAIKDKLSTDVSKLTQEIETKVANAAVVAAIKAALPTNKTTPAA